MSERSVYIKLIAVSTLWGCNYVASAYLLREFSPILLSFIRLIVMSLFLIASGLVVRSVRKPVGREWTLLLLAGFFGTLMNQFFYFTGLQYSTPGNAALINALTPIATMLLARMFLNETVTWLKVIGAVVALSGVGTIVLHGGASFGGIRGDVFLLLAMLGMSVSLLFIRKLTVSMPSFDVTIYSTVIGTILMTPAAGVEVVQGHTLVSHHILPWAILVTVAIIGQGLTGFWWNQAIKVVGAATSSLFMNVPPFIAIIASFFVLGDPIYLVQIAGGVLIIAGVTIANRKIKTNLPLAPTSNL